MILEVYYPKGILQTVVSDITWLSGGGTGVAFQRAYQVIIINMGDHFSTSDVYTEKPVPQVVTDTIWINGKQGKTFMLENKGLTAMYVIGVKYGMLPWLADLPAVETNDLAVGADNWTSKNIYHLREQLQECADLGTGFRLIEDHFTRLLLKKQFEAVEKVKWLNNAIHTTRVEEICRTLGITRKKLRQETQFYFGDSVKNIQGILRLNNTLRDIAYTDDQSLSSLHPYYDQSHFINDFKARTGITPLQYRRLCRQFPEIKYTPNFLSMSRETFLQFLHSGDR